MSYLTDPNELNPATVQWFRDNVLFGFTEDRERWRTNNFTLEVEGKVVPWFGRDDDPMGLGRGVPGTTGEPWTNGYPGPIPIEDVRDKLFNWTVEESPMIYRVPCEIHEADTMDDEGHAFKYKTSEKGKVLYRSDTGQDFEPFKMGYQRHQFEEWLLTKVGNIIGDELCIESAALLKGGAVAFVSVSLPDTVTGDAKYPLLVKLVASTSHDGSLVTKVILSAESPVCSNSLAGVLSAAKAHGKQFSVKHTRNSNARINSIQQALGLVQQHAEDSVAFFDRLSEWEVTNKEFRGLIDTITPVPEPVVDKGKVTNQRAITMAEGRQDDLAELWLHDKRVVPWQGTALGAVQAFNTWDQQVRGGVRGVRMERQMLEEINGGVAEFDGIVLASLSDVTGWSVEQGDDREFALVRATGPSGES